jgi:hypothetical protein
VSAVEAEFPDDNAPASAAAIAKVVAALQGNNIDVRVVETGEEARRLVLDLVPAGAEVHSGRSKTSSALTPAGPVG